MQGILKFTLPEEQDEFETSQKGMKYLIVLEDLDNHFRNQLKYNPNLTDDTAKAYEEVRSKIRELRDERGV